MTVNEPTYVYRKGHGWVVQSDLLTPEDFQGKWFATPNSEHYTFPPICRDWEILRECHDLHVGDMVPYGSHVKYIKRIEGDKAYFDRIEEDGRYLVIDSSDRDIIGVHFLNRTSRWIHVARRP